LCNTGEKISIENRRVLVENELILLLRVFFLAKNAFWLSNLAPVNLFSPSFFFGNSLLFLSLSGK
jgi:hypothetical protein